jgi:predicted metal-binding membrane protein
VAVGSGAGLPFSRGDRPTAGTDRRLAAPAALLLLAFGIVIVVTWVVTVLTANDLMTLLGEEVTGAAPIGHVAYFSLAAVMMTAMMLPSAIPMVTVYRGFARVDSSPREGDVRAGLFTVSYLAIWSAFAALVLVLVMELGLMGGLAGWLVLVPGGILVAAGVYQFTIWKRYCLERCQSPVGFLLGHWRPGRSGSVRLGFCHAFYCLGCCWLLMLVVFVTGAMSLLWMGLFSGLVLVEKVWGSTVWFTRGMGIGAVSVGAWVSALALGAPVLP